MSLRLKTILGVGCIEALLLIILITSVVNYMRDTSYADMENYVSTTTTLFAIATQDAVLSQDLATLDSFIEEILQHKGVVYAKITDSEKIILSEGGDHHSIVEGDHHVDTHISQVDDNVYDAQKTIRVEDDIYGHVYIGFSTSNVQAALNEIKKMSVIIAAIEMSLVAIFSYALGVYLTRQLSQLRKSAIRISAGDFDQAIDITSKDEIADVGRSFNFMMENLKKSQDELALLNSELEARVELRTDQLIKKNHELESAYEKLKTTQEQLIHSEKLASIGQLAAGVAHEINNPVAFVKGNLGSLTHYLSSFQNIIVQQQQIIEQCRDEITTKNPQAIARLASLLEEEDLDFINEDAKTLLTESLHGTKRVSDIVNSLKVYSGGQQDALNDVDVNECVNDTLRMLNSEIKYRCDLETSLDNVPVITGNAGKINQVLTNLVMNATQAIEKKGTITVTTQSKDNIVYVRVRDTGKGISPEHIQQLFDPFFTTKPVGQGTGLGLSISEGIVHDHGGEIRVTSQPGEGTEFVVSFPVNAA